jgi:hypothetical protein
MMVSDSCASKDCSSSVLSHWRRATRVSTKAQTDMIILAQSTSGRFLPLLLRVCDCVRRYLALNDSTANSLCFIDSSSSIGGNISRSPDHSFSGNIASGVDEAGK